jgi:arylsulfatase A-like enzyme
MRLHATTLGARHVTALITLAMVAGLSAAATSPVATAEDLRPNIVLITTDDMTDYDLKWMPETRRLLGEQGFEFTDFLSPHPLCCPARAEILTGQYAQNNGVHHNGGTWGASNLRDADNNVGRWLRDAGYQTAFIGKFLNGFQNRPDMNLGGWDIFNPSVDDIYSPYQFTYYNDGNPERIEGEYTADYVGRKTNEYVDTFSASDRPFFIWVSQVAPHSMKYSDEGKWQGPIPADRHQGMFSDVTSPAVRKPSFNKAVVDGESQSRRMPRIDVAIANEHFRKRIRSLQAVDEQVKSTVDTLEATGELADTVIIFTSDNGFLMGEHRLTGKNVPYEEALQIPLLLRGPGVPVGGTSASTTTMIDLAPTIADFADAVPQRVQDGTSMLPVAQGVAPGYERVLIQAGDVERKWSFRGVRTSGFTYVEHTNAVELYDRNADPYQLRNVAASRPRALTRLAAQLDTLRDCTGPTCYGGTP